MGGSKSGETCSDGIKCKPGRGLSCCWPSQEAPHPPPATPTTVTSQSPGLNHMELGCWQASVGLQIRVFVCICCFLYIKCELSVLSTPIFPVSRTVSLYTSHSENMSGCLSGKQEMGNTVSMASSAFSALVHPRDREDPLYFFPPFAQESPYDRP